ncbi:MAG TPA: hypothetical protein VK787_03025 [Puia sp.]|jgi:hypothetical protein|nr:hypothetical protein [Puia sp.]
MAAGFYSFLAMLLSKSFMTVVASYEVVEKLFLKVERRSRK